MSVQIGNWLIVIGVVLVIIGIAYKLGLLQWFGNLPGDIRYKGEKVTVYFPVATMIIISVILSLLFTLFRR